MEIPSIPPLSCPHCHTPNKVFVSQRCRSCQVAMMSDWEFNTMIEDIKPVAADLRMKLQALEAGKSSMKAVQQIQLLIGQLEPFQEGREWLATYLAEVKQMLGPVTVQYHAYRKNLTIFYIILAVFILVPIVALALKMDLMMVLLLALPIPGWYLLGIRAYQKKFNQSG